MLMLSNSHKIVKFWILQVVNLEIHILAEWLFGLNWGRGWIHSQKHFCGQWLERWWWWLMMMMMMIRTTMVIDGGVKTYIWMQANGKGGVFIYPDLETCLVNITILHIAFLQLKWFFKKYLPVSRFCIKFWSSNRRYQVKLENNEIPRWEHGLLEGLRRGGWEGLAASSKTPAGHFHPAQYIPQMGFRIKTIRIWR